jgi:hypothetical protein
MTHYADLSECSYFQFETNGYLKSVGWLDRAHEYPIGEIGQMEYCKLVELMNDPFQPGMFGGHHTCNICQFDGATGSHNLFIPGNGVIYVCPELITHYIACHRYKPPMEFLEAAMKCPDTRSMEYKKLLLVNNGRFLVRGNG